MKLKYVISIIIGLLVLFWVSLQTRTIVINNYPIEMLMIVTGYDSDENETDSSPFLTASQKMVKDGYIACPRSWPFGTRVIINSREFECQDRMNKRYKHRLDIWFQSKKEALKWGKQVLTIRRLF